MPELELALRDLGTSLDWPAEPDLEQRVLRVRGAPRDEVSSAKRDPLICLHEVSIGGFIALFGPFDEL